MFYKVVFLIHFLSVSHPLEFGVAFVCQRTKKRLCQTNLCQRSTLLPGWELEKLLCDYRNLELFLAPC